MSTPDHSAPPEPRHHESHTPDHHTDVGAAPPVAPLSGRRLLIIGGVAAAVLLIALILTLVPKHSVDNELRAEAAERDSAPAVQVTTVHLAPAGSSLALPGTIQALHESAIYARVTGYVRKWNADIGDVVQKGAVLAEIDAPELEQGVQQAQSQLSQTRAALALAKADLERWRSLARDSAVTGQELDQKNAAYEAAAANTGASEANLRRLVQTRQYTRVTAPFTGVVTARNVDIGSLITAAGATSAPAGANGTGGNAGPGSMFRIAQTDTVRTYITVPEAYATSIRPGLDATVTVQGIAGRTFTGHVARTSHSLDVSSRTLLTEVDVANRDLALLPGMFARATLQFPRVTPPMLLPASALLFRSGGAQVAVVEGSLTGGPAVLHFRPVQIARDYGSTVEISTGVTDGTTVVLNPNADLADGVKVRVLAATTAVGATSQAATSHR
jgi:membrane fusion protein (multidrug efflux system)